MCICALLILLLLLLCNSTVCVRCLFKDRVSSIVRAACKHSIQIGSLLLAKRLQKYCCMYVYCFYGHS